MAQSNGKQAVEEVAELEVEEVVVEEEIPGVVNIKDGGAGIIKGETISVRDGGAGIIQGKNIEMQDGGGMVVIADTISIKDGGAAVMVANQADLTDSTVVFLAAKQVNGDPKVIIDAKTAVVFAVLMGVVLTGLKLIFGRR